MSSTAAGTGRLRAHNHRRRPQSVKHPYQEYIWLNLAASDQQRYNRHCRDQFAHERTPSDIFDWAVARVPFSDSWLPPQDPTWQPNPPRASSPPLNTVLVNHPPPATAASPDKLTSALSQVRGLSESASHSTPTAPPLLSPANPHFENRPTRNALRTPWKVSRQQHSRQIGSHLQSPPPRRSLRQISQAPSYSTVSSVHTSVPAEDPIAGVNEIDDGIAQLNIASQYSENGKIGLKIDESANTIADVNAPIHADTDAGTEADEDHTWTEQDESILMLQNMGISTLSAPAPRLGNEMEPASTAELHLPRPPPHSLLNHVGPPVITNPPITRENTPSLPLVSGPSDLNNTDHNHAEDAVLPSPRRTQRRRRASDVDRVSPADVYRVIQTVTAFHCDCQRGRLQSEQAARHGFSLGELCRETHESRCFPPPGEHLPRPFDDSSPSSAKQLRIDLDRIDYAQYLSTHPRHGQPRTPLRLRSTTTFADPLDENFHVTWDVDSIWLRLTELSDLRVPVEIAYTAHRHINIMNPQHVPHFPSQTTIEPPLHGTAHSVFAKVTLASCTGSVYVYWPYLKDHKKGVVTDDVFAQWIDGVVMPARQSLESCAWQDHPKSFADAMAKARHRRETQIGGPCGVAVVAYTLSARYLLPLASTMRDRVTAVNETSPLYQFRSFSFVIIVHDLKRALNAQTPRFNAFDELRRLLNWTFHPAFLESDAFLDRSFADFGVEYNLHQRVSEPTTLLIRRTCLEHRLSKALLEQGGNSYIGMGQPEVFTAYSLYDAATGRVALPARAPASSVMPMIKAYSLCKHTCNSHLRHEFSESFSLPHLDLLCLSDDLLGDIHKHLPGSFHHRTLANIRNVLAATLHRLEEGQRANALSHTGVRIEPRISFRYLLGLLPEEEQWPSTFTTGHLHQSRQHPFVFALATADLSLYVRNFLQRMTAALGAQQFDLFGPIPAWDSITIRHRLGTTAVLLKIMATFFAGDEHKHQYMRATKYRSKGKGRRGVILLDQDAPSDLSTSTMAATDVRVRVGLMMDMILPQFGCYWLPIELFDFEPRVQVKLHLLSRITPTRPRLLSKVPLNWRTPIETRAAYQGDAITALVLDIARELARLPPLPSRMMSDYCSYSRLRMSAWLIWKPFVSLVARGFFQYVSSLTDKDPGFLALDYDEFDVPFHALTYDVVTRLLGEEPTLATPRESRKLGGETTLSWSSRLRYMFNARSQDQWQKTAPYLEQLRQWLKIFEATGVDPCYVELWYDDVGYLMRPFVWILPSYEKKTLFRLDKVDGQLGAAKRLRTRWHLPGVVVHHRVPLIQHRSGDTSRSYFYPVAGREAVVQQIHADRLKHYDPFIFADQIMEFLHDTMDEPQQQPRKKHQDHDHQIIDAILDFENECSAWFHKKINHRDHHGGLWIPFWSCGQSFPTDPMQELHGSIRAQQEQFQPEGGFHSLVEGHSDDDESEQSTNDEIEPAEFGDVNASDGE